LGENVSYGYAVAGALLIAIPRISLQTELLRRLLSMPDAEVEALAPEEQEGVMQVRTDMLLTATAVTQ
jgi:hypothetical protein